MANAYPTTLTNPYGLSNDEIRRTFPTVFAEDKHESRSRRYTYIPTCTILDELRKEGFTPTTVMQAHPRDKGRLGHAKHLLRLRHIDDLGGTRPDVPEAVVINSHDGTSSYQIMLGVFRMVCSNGQITGNINSQIRVHHQGNIVQEVIEATWEIVEHAEEIMTVIEEMKHIELSREEQLLLATYAMKMRFDLDKEEEKGGEEQGNIVEGSITASIPSTPQQKSHSTALTLYQPTDFLAPRRRTDAANDLYTVFNCVQENIIKGGVSREDTQGRKHTTRPIRNIYKNVKINQTLWQFAEELRQFKNEQ